MAYVNWEIDDIYFQHNILCLLLSLSCKYLFIQKQPPEVFCRKKVFLEILQNSQENTCARASFLIKLQAWGQ